MAAPKFTFEGFASECLTTSQKTMPPPQIIPSSNNQPRRPPPGFEQTQKCSVMDKVDKWYERNEMGPLHNNPIVLSDFG